jgi:hypothetical protein
LSAQCVVRSLARLGGHLSWGSFIPSDDLYVPLCGGRGHARVATRPVRLSGCQIGPVFSSVVEQWSYVTSKSAMGRECVLEILQEASARRAFDPRIQHDYFWLRTQCAATLQWPGQQSHSAYPSGCCRSIHTRTAKAIASPPRATAVTMPHSGRHSCREQPYCPLSLELSLTSKHGGHFSRAQGE